MGEERLEILKLHRAEAGKYTYFLLAVSASAIAYSAEKTASLKMELSMLPLGAAVLLWLASFFFGCRSAYHVNWSISANYAWLNLRVVPGQEEATKNLESRMGTSVSRATLYGEWQFFCLIAGAGFFLLWRVLKMVMRTFAAQQSATIPGGLHMKWVIAIGIIITIAGVVLSLFSFRGNAKIMGLAALGIGVIGSEEGSPERLEKERLRSLSDKLFYWGIALTIGGGVLQGIGTIFGSN